jgi:hypothetical protein
VTTLSPREQPREEHLRCGQVRCDVCGPKSVSRLRLHFQALGETLLDWAVWIVLIGGLVFLLALPGCFNAAEQGKVERAHNQAQAERQAAHELYQRGEIDEEAYHNRLDQADQVERDARAQASESATSRWLGDLLDPAALTREVLLLVIGLGAHGRVRDKSRRKALAALAAKAGGP